MGWLYFWWISLSGESKAAIIAAIVGPAAAILLGVPMRLVRWFYMVTLEKLKIAREQIQKDSGKAWRTGGIIDVENTDAMFPIPLEAAAKKARISLWRARRATRWHERLREFGNLSQ